MHTDFRLELDKTLSFAGPDIYPEEIDLWLNKGMSDWIAQRAFGNNPRKQSAEETQKRIDDLRSITTNYQYDCSTISTTADNKPNGIFVPLPSDYRHSLEEEATIRLTDCVGQSEDRRIQVNDRLHDKYNRMVRDPFNDPYDWEIYRLSYGNYNNVPVFELVGDGINHIIYYHMRYVRTPKSIKYGTVYTVPSTNQDCELASHTHREVVKTAINLILSNIESNRTVISNQETTKIE